MRTSFQEPDSQRRQRLPVTAIPPGFTKPSTRLIRPSEVSLVIPAHQDGPMLRRCLCSVASLDPPPKEVIIVVDGGSLQVADAVTRFPFRIILLPHSPGVAAARNIAVLESQGLAIAFLDSDTEARPDHILRAASALSDHPWADAVIGSYDASPRDRSPISLFRNLLHHHTHQNHPIETCSFWTGCGVITSEAFRLVGGFDEMFSKPSVEDIELGHRLRRAGLRIALAPDWQVCHLKKWTLRSMILTDTLARAFPWGILLAGNPDVRRGLSVDLRSKTSALLLMCCFASALAIPWKPVFALPGVLFLTAIVILNLNFYRFMNSVEGFRMALLSIPLHLLYYTSAVTGLLMAGVYQLSRSFLGRKPFSPPGMPRRIT